MNAAMRMIFLRLTTSTVVFVATVLLFLLRSHA